MGGFVCMTRKFLSKKSKFLDRNYLGLIIPKSRAVDIDNIEDWKLSEKIYKK